MRLHRIVGLAGDVVGGVDLDRRRGKRGIGIAAAAVGLGASRALAGLRDDRLGLGIARIDDDSLRRIADPERHSGTFGLIQRLGDDERDRLAEEAHLIVLEHVQPLARRRIDAAPMRLIIETRRVEMADDREHAGHVRHRIGVDRGDAAEANAARDDHRISLVRLVELHGIAGFSRHLGAPVDARKRLTNDCVHAISPAISSARTMVRCNRSSL